MEAGTLVVMRETSPKILLERKAARLRASTGNGLMRSKLAYKVTPQQVIVQALVHPTTLLIRSPVVLALSLYAALVFGVIYLLFTTFDGVFDGQYGFSTSVSGLVYVGLGIAVVLGVVIFGSLNPWIQATRMKSDGVDKPKPEYRLLLMIWLSPCVALGLFIYGWTAHYKVYWMVPIIGTFFIGLGAYFVLVSSILLRSSAYQSRSNPIRCLRSSTSLSYSAPKVPLRPWAPVTSCDTWVVLFYRWLGRSCTKHWITAGGTPCSASSRCCLPCLLFCSTNTANGCVRGRLPCSEWALNVDR